MDHKFNHFDENGNAHMVDVSSKDITAREAIATGKIYMSKECFEMVESGSHKKGDVLTIAQVAGILAAKKTSDMIPLTHNIQLSHVVIEFEKFEYGYIAISKISCKGQTGAEMEALHAVTISLLTIYDMCKAIDKRMHIEDIHLISKRGGKSGDFNY